MLLSFSVKNCRSFSDETLLSMFPAALRSRHIDHVIGRREGVTALRMAVLFGANGSGKSNLLYAMTLAVRAVQTNTCAVLADSQFRLSDVPRAEMVFSFVFAGSKKYAYDFTTDGRTVLSETLRWLKNRGDAEMIFERTKEGKIKLGKVLCSDWYGWRTLEPHMFWLRKLEEDGIRKQRLAGRSHILEALDFLGSFQFLNTAHRMPRLEPFFMEGSGFREFLRDFLHKADVGITDVIAEQLPEEETLRMLSQDPPPKGFTVMQAARYFHNGPRYLYFKRERAESPMVGYDLKTMHGKVAFPLALESDGTKRLFELAAVLWMMMHKQVILVADEIDAYLHPLLAKALLASIFQHAFSTSQAIFTTHCTTLITTDLFRPDEIWMIEKQRDGSSKVYSLSDYMPRADKRLERGYLAGIYGAVPIPGDFFAHNEGEAE